MEAFDEVYLAEVVAGLGELVEEDGQARYMKSEYCLENLKELQRSLRRDNPATRDVFLQLGKWNVVHNDLVKLIVTYRDEYDIVLHAVKVLVFLTMPVSLDSERRALQLEYIQAFKSAVLSGDAMPAFVALLEEPMKRVQSKDMTDDDCKLVQLVLTLLRNLVAIPDRSPQSSAASGDAHMAYMQDDIIESFLRENVMEILVSLIKWLPDIRGLKDDNMLFLEIIHHLFKGRQPAQLVAAATAQAGKPDEDKASKMREKLQREDDERRRAMRYPRFGAMFVRHALDGTRRVVAGDPFKTSLDRLDMLPTMKRGNVKPVASERETQLPSNRRVLAILKDFADQILSSSYNVLMSSLKEDIKRERHNIQEADVIVFFCVAGFFTAYQHQILSSKSKKKQVVEEEGQEPQVAAMKSKYAAIAATMKEDMFMLLVSKWRLYHENAKDMGVKRRRKDDDEEVLNRNMSTNYWGGAAAACSLFKDMVHILDLTLKKCDKTSEGANEQHQARMLLNKVFYDQTETGVLPSIQKHIAEFDIHVQPRSDLADMVEVTHVILRLLEDLSKSDDLLVMMKARKSMRSKKATKDPPEKGTADGGAEEHAPANGDSNTAPDNGPLQDENTQPDRDNDPHLAKPADEDLEDQLPCKEDDMPSHASNKAPSDIDKDQASSGRDPDADVANSDKVDARGKGDDEVPVSPGADDMVADKSVEEAERAGVEWEKKDGYAAVESETNNGDPGEETQMNDTEAGIEFGAKDLGAATVETELKDRHNEGAETELNDLGAGLGADLDDRAADIDSDSNEREVESGTNGKGDNLGEDGKKADNQSEEEDGGEGEKADLEDEEEDLGAGMGNESDADESEEEAFGEGSGRGRDREDEEDVFGCGGEAEGEGYHSGDEEEAPPVMETKLDFRKCVEMFASNSVVQNYCWLLGAYKENSAATNHYILKMMRRLAEDMKLEALFYQLSVLHIFYKILNDPAMRGPKATEYDHLMVSFLTRMVRDLFTKMKDQPLFFLEVLFWKTRNECISIMHDYYSNEIDKLNGGKKRSNNMRDALGDDENGNFFRELGSGDEAPNLFPTSRREREKKRRKTLFNEEEEAKLKELFDKYKDESGYLKMIAAELADGKFKPDQVSRKLTAMGFKRNRKTRKSPLSESDTEGSDKEGDDAHSVDEAEDPVEGGKAGGSKKKRRKNTEEVDEDGNGTARKEKGAKCSGGSTKGKAVDGARKEKSRLFNKDDDQKLRELFDSHKEKRAFSEAIAAELEGRFKPAQVSRRLRALGLVREKKQEQKTKAQKKKNDVWNWSDSEDDKRGPELDGWAQEEPGPSAAPPTDAEEHFEDIPVESIDDNIVKKYALKVLRIGSTDGKDVLEWVIRKLESALAMWENGEDDAEITEIDRPDFPIVEVTEEDWSVTNRRRVKCLLSAMALKSPTATQSHWKIPGDSGNQWLARMVELLRTTAIEGPPAEHPPRKKAATKKKTTSNNQAEAHGRERTKDKDSSEDGNDDDNLVKKCAVLILQLDSTDGKANLEWVINKLKFVIALWSPVGEEAANVHQPDYPIIEVTDEDYAVVGRRRVQNLFKAMGLEGPSTKQSHWIIPGNYGIKKLEHILMLLRTTSAEGVPPEGTPGENEETVAHDSDNPAPIKCKKKVDATLGHDSDQPVRTKRKKAKKISQEESDDEPIAAKIKRKASLVKEQAREDGRSRRAESEDNGEDEEATRREEALKKLLARRKKQIVAVERAEENLQNVDVLQEEDDGHLPEEVQDDGSQEKDAEVQDMNAEEGQGEKGGYEAQDESDGEFPLIRRRRKGKLAKRKVRKEEVEIPGGGVSELEDSIGNDLEDSEANGMGGPAKKRRILGEVSSDEDGEAHS